MAADCLRRCLKVLYTLILLLKLLISFIFIPIGIGCLFLGDQAFGAIDKELKGARDQAINNLPPDFKKFAPDDFIPKIDSDKNQAQFQEIVEGLATAILAIGFLLFASTFIGCCACCECFSSLSWIFYLIQIGISAGFVVAIGVVYGKGKESFRGPMEHSVQEYKGLTDLSIYSVLLSGIMVLMGCCGVDGGSDFASFDSWRPERLRGYTIDVKKITEDQKKNSRQQLPPITVNTNLEMLDIPQSMKDTCKLVEKNNEIRLHCPSFDSNTWKTPMACCKNVEEVMDGCMVNPTKENNNIFKGCLEGLDYVVTFFKDNTGVDVVEVIESVFGLCIAILLLDVLLGCVLIFLIKRGGRQSQSYRSTRSSRNGNSSSNNNNNNNSNNSSRSSSNSI